MGRCTKSIYGAQSYSIFFVKTKKSRVKLLLDDFSMCFYTSFNFLRFFMYANSVIALACFGW